ncbi:MAG: hypothetical protein Q9227_008603 [Pyrenula ochraceoflavens]
MEDDSVVPLQPPHQTPSSATNFIPPSVHHGDIVVGNSYTHYTPLPPSVTPNPSPESSLNAFGTPCTLGIDEAGRGPSIGPMTYCAFYLPTALHPDLLTSTPHVFNDSKSLAASFRSTLMQALCAEGSPLQKSCGWALKSLSARDISCGMLRRQGKYNLNGQAIDATIEVIKGILDRGVNVREIYVDALGPVVTHQKRLERIFPNIKIVVETKADAKYPVVSAASVVAKVTRDVTCELLYGEFLRQRELESKESKHGLVEEDGEKVQTAWGSGYPSDARTVEWLKSEMDPVFGWGPEYRFSWGGKIKDFFESREAGATKVDWPTEDTSDSMKMTDYFSITRVGSAEKARVLTEAEQIAGWFGTRVGAEAF